MGEAIKAPSPPRQEATSFVENVDVQSGHTRTARFPVSDRDQLAEEFIGGGYGIGPPDCGANGRSFPKTDCLWPGCPTRMPLVIESFLGSKLKVVQAFKMKASTRDPWAKAVAAKLKGTLLESDDDDFEKEEGEKEEGEKDEEENNEEEKDKDVDEK